MKKVLSIVLSLLLVLVLAAACSNGGGEASQAPEQPASKAPEQPASEAPAEKDDESPEEPAGDVDVANLKIGIVMKSFDEFQQAVIDGATDKAIEMGVKAENIKAVAPKVETDVMEQVQMLEDFVSQDYDIILIAPNQPDTVMNALNSAVEKGIKIVMVDTDAPDFMDKVTYIGTDNETAAYDGALEFSAVLPEEANVIVLRGKLGDPNHEKRTAGMTRALEEKGHNILVAHDANCETDKAASAMEDFLNKYEDIDGVMVTSDSMAVGAVTAIQQANRMEDIKVCGFDGFQVAIEGVRDGNISMIIAQKPYYIGQMGVECGIGALNGETYDIYINSGIAMITPDNYEEFLN
ncbi:MAG: substrate-binding domain-containing protein [Christensenellales bacterium]|jgi:ribose transport system substrate-binding protein